MAQTVKADRAYFWSNSYASPKAKSKFLIEFGGLLASVFNSKYSWLVKSVNRPKYSAEYEDFKNTISYATTSALPKAWNWEPVTVKFVNPFSMTFWPADLQQDFDLFLSNFAQDFITKKYTNVNNISDNPYPDVKVVQQDMEVISKPASKYLGSSIKIYDLSMGYQSPGLGTAGGEFAGKNSNAQGKEMYSDITNPNLSSLELRLAEMYANGYWELFNPWITKIDLGDNDYSVDEFIEISITFKFQNAKYVSLLRTDQMAHDPDKFAIVLENAANDITKINQAYSNHELSKKDYQDALMTVEKAAADAELKSRPKANDNNTAYNQQRLQQLQALNNYADTSLDLVAKQEEVVATAAEVKKALQSGERDYVTDYLTVDIARAAREEEAIARQNQTAAQQQVNSYSSTSTIFDQNPEEYQQTDQTVPRTRTTNSTNQRQENSFGQTTTPAPAVSATPTGGSNGDTNTTPTIYEQMYGNP